MKWQNTETPTFRGSDGTEITGPDVVENMQLLDRDGVVLGAFQKSVAGTVTFNVAGSISQNDVALETDNAQRIGNTASYIRTTNGAQTLLAANGVARVVLIVVKVATTFAAGDGAAPVFDIGETDTPEKFKADLNTGTAGDTLVFAGQLTAAKALLVTATAATGTTSTGAIDVTVLALPLS